MKQILIVEDESVLGYFLSELLKGKGYAVEICSDGASGLDRIKQGSLDLIMLDLYLPGLNGVDILKAMTEANITIPVLVISALTDKSVVDFILTQHIRGFIMKPFETAQIIECVNEVIGTGELKKPA